MSSVVSTKQVSDGVKPYLGISPQTISGSTPIDGTAVDRISGDNGAPYESLDLEVGTGASTNSPTSYAHTFTVQHSTASGSGFANYTDPTTGNVATATATTDASMVRLAVNLIAANQYIRIVCTPVFVGGSSPTTPVSCHLVLGGAATTPTPT